MARNRKNESAASRFAPALKALLLFAFFVTAGVGFVWYKNQIKVLGDDVHACEKKLEELRTRNASLSDQLKVLRSPTKIEAQVKKLNLESKNLDLGPPALSQVIRLVESAPESTPPGSTDSSALKQARPSPGKSN